MMGASSGPGCHEPDHSSIEQNNYIIGEFDIPARLVV
jgi:hypothetical protein